MGVRVREKPKGSGVWWVFVAHRAKRRAKRIGDHKAANKVASRLREELSKGDFRLPAPSPSFETAAREWLEHMPTLRDIRVSTAENYRSFTERHLIPYFGRRPVGDITTQAVEAFIAAKRGVEGSTRFPGKPLARSSLRVGLVALRLILQRALKAGYLPANPVRELDRLPRGDNPTAVDPFTTDELRAILMAAHDVNPAFAVMLRVWAQTGMRAGEVAALRWSDMDVERGTAVVQRTYSRKRIGPTKTGVARTVSLLYPVTEVTPEWRPGATGESRSVLTALRRLTVRSLDPEGYIFGGDAPMESNRVNTLWRRVLAKAGVRYRVGEQLRHTWASTLLSRNAPLLLVQAGGGWRSASVLLKVYARWLPSELDRLETQPAATLLQPVREAAGAIS